ncbi:hypothetical protein C439_16813 [Haloferax mediterranei ATCC 33500]|uniref:Uncharacterized protein n=1 Tax=Haloferax mediterranei (strain ATCC 33500 / DSM 1411 / JCM 8866 / NBRC 14739 / NCIMB 2177 / R-4) TaxID=523841 RepID=I3R923_HALMT|nr:hypothetical protein HFX_4038 [Haloferax mediterranei ATCC 33500]ELZ97597.1 hypothetical protein C439_16813 [Haloferax mediterranei ATCC 33500]
MSQVYEFLFQELEKVGGTIVLVLDEIGLVDGLDTLFYQLTRSRGKGGEVLAA